MWRSLFLLCKSFHSDGKSLGWVELNGNLYLSLEKPLGFFFFGENLVCGMVSVLLVLRVAALRST